MFANQSIPVLIASVLVAQPGDPAPYVQTSSPQVAPAGAAPASAGPSIVPRLLTEESGMLKELLSPSAGALAASREKLDVLREDFARLQEVWRTAFRRADFASAVAVYDAMMDPSLDCARRYRGLFGNAQSYSPVLTAIDLGHLDEDVLESLQPYLSGAVEPGFDTRDRFEIGEIYYHLLRGDRDAAVTAASRFRPLFGDPTRELVEALVALAEDPSFDVRITALTRLAATDEFRLADYALAWELYDEAENDAELAKCASHLAALSGQDWQNGWPGSLMARSFAEAAARLAAADDVETRAEALAQIADAEAHALRLGVAATLYVEVSNSYPESPQWGRATYNAGLLLGRIEEHALAISVLMRLFASDVDDSEPSGDIMRPYRNYRHQASKQISSRYEALGEYEKAHDWMRAADERYRLVSSCGTCSSGARKTMKAQLERLRELAGR
jgi:hypothetical protein